MGNQHFRFRVPIWQVRGTSFPGMGRDESIAVFSVTEKSPRRESMEARRSFLGLDV
jgi:hypothetical protein